MKNRSFTTRIVCCRIVHTALVGAIMSAMAQFPAQAQEGQQATGSLHGSVAAQLRAQDGKAQVIVRNTGTHAVQIRPIDAEGHYSLDGLSPGDYEITLMHNNRTLAKAKATVRADNSTTVPQLGAPGVDQEFATMVVKGIRGSIASARDKKREARNIVDAIVSEDAGKLPDNNVVEALSRVTGVQIDRARGEGAGLTIRGIAATDGMESVQTTVNGNSNSVGESRSANLSDIPAELLKSVEVHKNRTADQVEGGIAGTVNVELRRPFDLPDGDTFAASARSVYNDIAEEWSPYGSLLWSDRFNTDWGEFGYLINASYTNNRYEETLVDSESPAQFWGPLLEKLPADMKHIVAPYRVYYNVLEGQTKRPSLNLSTQWRPTDSLEFVLEGSYFGSKGKHNTNGLGTTIKDDAYAPSDIVLAADGVTLNKVRLSRDTDAGVNGGPTSTFSKEDSDNYTTNFEANWRGEQLDVSSSVQYNWSKTGYYSLYHAMSLDGVDSVTLDFSSDNVPHGGPYIDYGDALTDLDNYRFFQLHDDQTNAKSNELMAQLDLTWTPMSDGFITSLQGGWRFTDRDTKRHYGYRDAYPVDGGDGQAPLLSDMTALGSPVLTTTPNLDGATSVPSWYHLSGSNLLSNWPAVLDYMGRYSSAWNSWRPSDDQGNSFVSNERTMATYAQVNYGFELGVPIDGTAGVRMVRTWGGSSSSEYRINTETGESTVTDTTATGSYTDVIPSINAIVHLAGAVQLRLAYSENVQRPSFYDMRPSATYEIRPAETIVYSGNPDLKPVKEENYDASLEYYFGRAGSASLAAFLKKPTGYLYYSRESELVPGLGRVAQVEKLRNAGPGEFRGYELSVYSFFDFLPGFWSNFGASANFTYLDRFYIRYPVSEEETKIPGIYDAPGTSRSTLNIALYYDTPKFSTRLAYNRRSKRRDFLVTANHMDYSAYTLATSRLDAAINYTPYRFITYSLEATNLLDDDQVRYWGPNEYLPMGPRYEARTLQFSVRMRWD